MDTEFHVLEYEKYNLYAAQRNHLWKLPFLHCFKSEEVSSALSVPFQWLLHEEGSAPHTQWICYQNKLELLNCSTSEKLLRWQMHWKYFGQSRSSIFTMWYKSVQSPGTIYFPNGGICNLITIFKTLKTLSHWLKSYSLHILSECSWGALEEANGYTKHEVFRPKWLHQTWRVQTKENQNLTKQANEKH